MSRERNKYLVQLEGELCRHGEVVPGALVHAREEPLLVDEEVYGRPGQRGDGVGTGAGKVEDGGAGDQVQGSEVAGEKV